jgi:ribosomal protein L11 methyltransferase
MYSLSIKSKPGDRPGILPLLYRYISWGWEETDQDEIIIHFTGRKQAAEFKKLVMSVAPESTFDLKPVTEKDWTEDWKQYFTPIRINDTFIILPEWLEHEPSNLIRIIITPKMAFGTGHHATTCLCLKILSSLSAKGVINIKDRFLDLGTGSGILGIAGAKLGLSGLGIDMDPSAVDNARENISLNKVQDRFQVKTAEISAIERDRKFNLVFANILASTLVEFVPEILSFLDADRYCLILSGILDKQVQAVTEAYEGSLPGRPEIWKEGEWAALVWTHNYR